LLTVARRILFLLLTVLATVMIAINIIEAIVIGPICRTKDPNAFLIGLPMAFFGFILLLMVLYVALIAVKDHTAIKDGDALKDTMLSKWANAKRKKIDSA
jgi:hypothetical protein